MKFTSILAVASTILAFANAQDLPTLAQKWNISDEPTFKYSSLSFELGYTVSNFISNVNPVGQMAKFNLYDAGCKEGGNEITYQISSTYL